MEMEKNFNDMSGALALRDAFIEKDFEYVTGNKLQSEFFSVAKEECKCLEKLHEDLKAECEADLRNAMKDPDIALALLRVIAAHTKYYGEIEGYEIVAREKVVERLVKNVETEVGKCFIEVLVCKSTVSLDSFQIRFNISVQNEIKNNLDELLEESIKDFNRMIVHTKTKKVVKGYESAKKKIFNKMPNAYQSYSFPVLLKSEVCEWLKQPEVLEVVEFALSKINNVEAQIVKSYFGIGTPHPYDEEEISVYFDEKIHGKDVVTVIREYIKKTKRFLRNYGI